jgi:glycosyltransferase involved in cell wall biosynthesis
LTGPWLVYGASAASFLALVAVSISTRSYTDILLGVLVVLAIIIGVLNRRVMWAVRGEQRVQSNYVRSIEQKATQIKLHVSTLGQPGGGARSVIQRVGADNEYARRVGQVGPGLIETYALQNRSESARDVLARAASGHQHDAASLVTILKLALRDPRKGWARDFLRGLQPRPAASLAKVLAQQGLYTTDTEDALAIYRALVTAQGSSKLDRHNRLIYLELLAENGLVEELRLRAGQFDVSSVNAAHANLLPANAVNPFGGADEGEERLGEWLEHVNAVFRADGIEMIDVAPGTGPAMDRIRCQPASTVPSGPKVTVIVPTFDPDERIVTAIESLVGQSYRNLEILIMDDFSPASSAAALDRWSERDPRIKVVHLPENRGSYKARNVAVADHATGEFITVHDDDDWSHPRKIERQVKHLLDHPQEPANMSMLSRATPDLVFTRINNNPLFIQPNFSSLMVRRSTFDTLGFWDVVNRSADAEMRDRIIAWSGHPVPTVGEAPMSFLRVRATSLTAGEIFKGYVDPRRMWYQRLSRASHARRNEAGESLWVGPDVRDERPFTAPIGLIGSKNAGIVQEVDIVYATDFRFPGGNSSVAAREIEALVAHGYTVGLAQFDSPLLGPRNVLHPDVVALADHPDVAVLSLLDDVRAGLTIVRHPTVLQFARPVRSSILTERLVVVVNHPPFEADLTGSVYDMSRVVTNAESIFGCRPTVAPESGHIRSLLAGLVAPTLLAGHDWNGIVGGSGGRVRSADPARPYVMGRHSRDHLHKWPEARLLPHVYPLDGSRDVRILGGADQAVQRLGREITSWTVYPFGSKPAEEFLEEVDFWVYFHGPELFESFGMATAEAMSAGLVVILPRYMEPTFGEGALYCSPDEVVGLMDALWQDPDAFAAQSEKAMAFAASHFADKAFLDRVRSYLTPFTADVL